MFPAPLSLTEGQDATLILLFKAVYRGLWLIKWCEKYETEIHCHNTSKYSKTKEDSIFFKLLLEHRSTIKFNHIALAFDYLVPHGSFKLLTSREAKSSIALPHEALSSTKAT
jgi:hypothetical protein